MAAYALHNFDSSSSSIPTSTIDASQHNFASFDDYFSVDSTSFTGGPNAKHGNTIGYPYDVLSETTQGLSHRPTSAGASIGLTSSSENFMFHPPSIWQDLSEAQKSALRDVDPDFCTSAATDSIVDYSFLAGETGLFGVGECGKVSSSPASVTGSQVCPNDVFFSSPSSCSSMPTTYPESACSSLPKAAGSWESSRNSSYSQQLLNQQARNSEEPIFKAPSTPASAMPSSKTNKSSPRPSRSGIQAPSYDGDFRTPVVEQTSPFFSTQGSSMGSLSFSPPLHYLDNFSLKSGNFAPPYSTYPSIIHQPNAASIHPYGAYPIGAPMGSVTSQPPSIALSPVSQNSSHPWNASQRNSPFPSNPIPNYATPSSHPSRPPSLSRVSLGSPPYTSVEIDDEGKERTQCPYPDCGKSFKDLKAHMLTHQNERPEKCPITSCEFHKRGFARKYDRNRHLVTTHYKATIVCGFCPGSGSSAEKSFNRTDVFKRHLVTVHGVEQSPSNSKKKTPANSARQSPALAEDATGKCSTCGQIFATPQELFEHFDDCVLRVVTQTDPAEEANEKNLRSIAEDGDVKATLDRHSLATDMVSSPSSGNGDPNEDSDGAEEINTASRSGRSGRGYHGASRGQTSGNVLHTVTDGHVSKGPNWGKASGKGRAGVTYSNGGVSLSVGKGRKKKKFYPQSWGCPTDKMKLKKRVLCVFDGQRRLWKDDMMLGDDFEVRMKLPHAEDNSWVTDLDVETMKRAEGFHAATEEERGPWIPSNYSGDLSAQMFHEYQQQRQQQ